MALADQLLMSDLQAAGKRESGPNTLSGYEAPRTPYARLLEAEEVSPEQKEKLRALRSGLDPLKLRREPTRSYAAFLKLQRTMRQDFARRSVS
jgi:hypothetical protein